MDWDRLKRRSYLGGVVATLTGLAGCNETDGTPTRTTSETPRDALTDTEAAETTDSQTADEQPLRPHDHSGDGAGGATLAPRDVHGTVYAAAMPGDDLSAKVRNAIDAIPAGGTVVVTPRTDGNPWQWHDTVTVNLNGAGGVTLRFRGMTMVEYTGNGWAIETVYEPAEYGQLNRGDFFELRGGHWRATGDDPAGWLRMVDTNFAEIEPELVIDFTNSDKTATGVRVENRGMFCESNVFTGHFAGVDIGMDFVPAAATGGSGTNSFEGNYIRNLKVLNAKRTAFRWRDGANFSWSVVQNTDAFAASYDVADEVVLYDFGGKFNGTTFVGPKIEDGGSEDVADIGYRVRDSVGTPPLLINPRGQDAVDTLVEYADRYKSLPALMVWDDGRRSRAGVHDFGRFDQEPRFGEECVIFPSARVHGADSRNPDTPGKVIYADGDVDGMPEGLYRADPENSQWVKVSDNSITYED
ncbi:hypothetical protein [Halostella litorea]|uniref:hypothetical protein n=1 Tax=Halostella litorea TaxID=2528831 RepID=UPI0010919A94|nr:hypothetical protein [Halostella litorea]